MASKAKSIAARRRRADLYGEQTGKAGFGLPGKSVKQRVRDARAEGTKGKDLKAFRRQAKSDRRDELAQEVPEAMRKYVKHPAKFIKKQMSGKGPQPFRRLSSIQQVDKMLGLQQDRDIARKQLSQQYDPETGEAKINYREDELPVMSQMEGYIGDRLGQGFTPEERAAYYGAQHDPLMAQASQNYENEMSRLAASGMDPRSGIAASRAAGIQAQTGRGLAEAGRATEAANLARKAQIEGYAQDMGALEERKRESMVTSNLGRLGQIEQGLAGQAELGEKGREFDYELAEGQRQAELRRRDIEKAAKRLEPSTLEKVAGGISGFLGGLTGGGMGGGGGGGGGMGGMMGG